jgi:hypothetical protein
MRMRRTVAEALMSVGTVAILLFALVVFDPRIREQISRRVAARPVTELASTGQYVESLSTLAMGVARQQGGAHAPLLIFTLAGAVLVVFMLRT